MISTQFSMSVLNMAKNKLEFLQANTKDQPGRANVQADLSIWWSYMYEGIHSQATVYIKKHR